MSRKGKKIGLEDTYGRNRAGYFMSLCDFNSYISVHLKQILFMV